MAELISQSFAGYEVIGKLGQGGMGAVYKARQPMLNRLIALKVLAPNLAGDADFVARFQRETRSAANLSHPNIVQVYAGGEHEGVHYMAMEFVEGESLQKRLERTGKMDPDEALAVCHYVAQGLHYAWQKNQIIHRDIKPDNIYLSDGGDVKVGDLGLAKQVGANATGLTHTGTAMGTPHYISPEQAKGEKEIDFRADIYSLGCTLYHMLTGLTPYDGDSAMVVMGKHLNNPQPAILKVWPQCPMRLVFLLGKMLKKNPRERHQNYEELLEEIVAVRDKVMGQSSAPVPAAAPQPPPSTPRIAAARTPTVAKVRKSPVTIYAAVGVAAVIAIGGFFAFKATKPASNAGTAAAIANTLSKARTGSLPASSPTASAPGNALTFAGHRYQLVREKLKWMEAKARAEVMGGHLARITSKAQNEWIWGNITSKLKRIEGKANSDRCFIGAIQRNWPDGPWEWVTGQTFTPQPWMGNFPNDKTGGTKVATLLGKTWDDVGLNYSPLPFLVEWDDGGSGHASHSAPGGWRPLLTDAMKQNKNVTVLPDGWVLVHNYILAPPGKDMALRCRVRFSDKMTYMWLLRFRDTPTKGLLHYGVNITRNGKFGLHRRVQEGSRVTADDKPLQTANVSRQFANDEEFEVEVTAQSDRLTVKLDGAMIIDVRDNFHQGARNQFGGDVEFKNVEWRDLSAVK